MNPTTKVLTLLTSLLVVLAPDVLAQVPNPTITDVVLLDDEVQVDEPFQIQVVVRNDGGDATYGSISLSFPAFTDPSDGVHVINDVSNSPDDPGYRAFAQGVPLGQAGGGPAAPADYLLSEYGDDEWQSGEVNFISVTVRPQRAGTFEIYVRANMGYIETDEYYNEPTSGPLDQQGWPVEVYTVEVTGGSQESGLVQDSLALVALYNAAGGPGWDRSDNWLSGPVSTWHGVIVVDERVASLSLSSNELSGQIPPEVGQLTSLGALYLGSNQLSGPLPSELGQLTGLGALDLGFNQLSGPIPPELGQLTGLQLLALTANQLSGPIPPELGQLTGLRLLLLNSNQLSGPIPAALTPLENLRSLNLSYNQLSGSIPPELRQLSALRSLSLNNNQLSGSIPPEFGQLGALGNLALSNNQLSGPLPYSFLDLDLNLLRFEDTSVCEPDTPEFQQWLSEINFVGSTDVLCSDSEDPTSTPHLLEAIALKLNSRLLDAGVDPSEFYASNQKYLGFLSIPAIGIPIVIPGVGSLKVSIVDLGVYIDLFDYLGLTEEGQDGWVTVWTNLDFGAGVSGGPNPLPINAGVVYLDFSDTDPDPQRELSVSIVDGSTFGLASIELLARDETGFNWADATFNEEFELNASLTIGSASWNFHRGEFKRLALDELVSDWTEQVAGPVTFLGNNVVDNFFEFDGQTIKPSYLPPTYLDANSYRAFTSLDGGGPREISGQIEYARGGIDEDEDGISDNVFGSTPLFPFRGWPLRLRWRATGNSTTDYYVRVEGVPTVPGPDSWIVGAVDNERSTFDPQPIIDRQYESYDILAGEYVETLWAVAFREDASDEVAVRFTLYEDRRFLPDVALDYIDVQLRQFQDDPLAFTGRSPIDLEVTSPSGEIYSRTSYDERYVAYNSYDTDENGSVDAQIVIARPEVGDYGVLVVPHDTAQVTDTYSLDAIVDNEITVLAENVTIENVPQEPYVFNYEGDLTAPVCGPISFEFNNGNYEIVSSATDNVGITSATITHLTSNLDVYIDGEGPFAEGDVVTLPEAPTSVDLLARVTELSGRLTFLVTVADAAGNEAVCDPVITDLDGTLPQETALGSVYPNPTHLERSSLTVPFTVAEPTAVRITVYDVLGREVAVLADEDFEAGSYEVQWAESRALPAGVYLVRFQAGTHRETQRITLLR